VKYFYEKKYLCSIKNNSFHVWSARCILMSVDYPYNIVIIYTLFMRVYYDVLLLLFFFKRDPALFFYKRYSSCHMITKFMFVFFSAEAATVHIIEFHRKKNCPSLYYTGKDESTNLNDFEHPTAYAGMHRPISSISWGDRWQIDR